MWKSKNYNICEKDYIWNPVTCSCENGKYLANIIDDSVISRDKIIEETKTVPSNDSEKKDNLYNTKFLYFTCLFINYYIIIDSF